MKFWKNATLKNRIVIGNKVINKEDVTGIKPNAIVKAVAIDEVKDNLIENVWFIFFFFYIKNLNTYFLY